MKKKEKHLVEVIVHDPVAQSLQHLFLPPPGSHVDPETLKDACARLAEATREMKRLERDGKKES